MTEVTATGGDSFRKNLFHSPQRLPVWLRRSVPRGPQVERVRRVISAYGLHSVCEAAACPNRLECYSKGRVAFMILGDICTRNCGYCRVTTGKPLPANADEPERVGSAAMELELSYVVVTSVCRDDLSDGGASQFAQTIEALRAGKASTKVEVLVPEFHGSFTALETVLEAQPTVLNHNVETVPRLYGRIRPQGRYEWAVDLLSRAKRLSPGTVTKSGLMVGLGERDDEILSVLRDLRSAQCEVVTIGQYMRPSLANHPVQRYVTPREFHRFEVAGTDMGFRRVVAGPLVRSSYMSESTYSALGATRQS